MSQPEKNSQAFSIALEMLDLEWQVSESSMFALNQELKSAQSLELAGSVRSRMVLVHNERIAINVRRLALTKKIDGNSG